jgi:predicted peptidase
MDNAYCGGRKSCKNYKMPQIIDMKTIFTFLLSAFVCFATSAKGTITKHEREVTNGYNFLLYEPESVGEKLPIIIALHGGSACGNDLDMVDNFGTMDALESGMELNAYVVAPQNSSRSDWSADKIMNIVAYIAQNYSVDTNRISAIGMSMGAYGVADLIAAYPDNIAAGIVLGGGLAHGDAANLNKVPLWIIRGLKDREDAIARTEKTVKEMRKADTTTPRLVYTKVEGLDHRQHERALYMADFYNWLLSHSITDDGRAVNPVFEVSTKTLSKSYKGLNIRSTSQTKKKSRRPARPGFGPHY